MGDQLVAETATYTTYKKHKRKTSIPSPGFESALPAIKRLQNYALAHKATGFDRTRCRVLKKIN